MPRPSPPPSSPAERNRFRPGYVPPMPSDSASLVQTLLGSLPQVGRLEQILLRPDRKAPTRSVDRVPVVETHGLIGDRFKGSSPRSKRQVTLIQAEHLPVIAALAGHDAVDPATLRRNLVVSGIPVAALKGRRLRIGADVVLEYTSPCAPCSKMEAALGPGGFNAMRGMGGICCRVLQAGEIAVGDAVVALPVEAGETLSE